MLPGCASCSCRLVHSPVHLSSSWVVQHAHTLHCTQDLCPSHAACRHGRMPRLSAGLNLCRSCCFLQRLLADGADTSLEDMWPETEETPLLMAVTYMDVDVSPVHTNPFSMQSVLLHSLRSPCIHALSTVCATHMLATMCHSQHSRLGL